MCENQKCYVKWKKPDINDYVVPFTLHSKRQNYRERKWFNGCQRLRVDGGHWLQMYMRKLLGSNGFVLHLDCGHGCTAMCTYQKSSTIYF